ncbi:MAG: hypothetical protein HKO63_08325 [Acidimicrobiia bacterium]|nr:hypothetical protein [Acidimicrobiia bacterium]
MLVESYGVTEEEAREQISLQSAITRLRGSLVNDKTFAGIWVERNPYIVRVAFTSEAEKRTEALRSEFPKPEALAATEADFSLMDLEEAVERIRVAVRSGSDLELTQLEDRDVWIRLRPSLNAVEVITPSFETVKSVADSVFPVGMVTVIEGPKVEIEPTAWTVRGGEPMDAGTTGWVIRKNNSTETGLITAEHASPTTYNNHPIEDRLQEYNDADGDVLWLSLRDKNWAPNHEIGTSDYPYLEWVVGTVSYSVIGETDVVCSQGKTTGTTCGEVLSKTAGAGNLIESNFYLLGGDSGGPVWMDVANGVNAAGVNTALAGPVPWYKNPSGVWVDTVSLFSSVSFFQDRWDVSVATSVLPEPAFDWFLINHHPQLPTNWSVAEAEWEYGETGWTTVAGDWLGVGHDQPGNFASGWWNLEGVPKFRYGIAGDLPIVGDWDGDGIDEVGVYRPSQEKFYRQGTTPIYFSSSALPGDLPVAGDWDDEADDKDEIGIFRPSAGFWILRNGDSSLDEFYYGIPNDNPVTGDWNNNGQDTVGVVRPNGRWLLRNTNDLGTANEEFWFGGPGDRFLPGNWDGLSFDTAGITR